MEPRVVADAVEAGEEDVVMEALRTYNREVSESRERGTCTEEVGQGGARALAGPEIVCAAGGLREVRAPREGRRVGEELLGGESLGAHTEGRGWSAICPGGGICGLRPPSTERPEPLGLSAELPELHV